MKVVSVREDEGFVENIHRDCRETTGVRSRSPEWRVDRPDFRDGAGGRTRVGQRCDVGLGRRSTRLDQLEKRVRGDTGDHGSPPRLRL